MKPFYKYSLIFMLGLFLGTGIAYKTLPTKIETKVVEKIVKVEEATKTVVTTKTDKFDPKTGKIVETTTKNKTKVSDTMVSDATKETVKVVINQNIWLVGIHYFPKNIPLTSISLEDLALSVNYRIFSSLHIGVLGGPRVGVGLNVGISF